MSAISCQQRLFGTLKTGQAVTCYSLRNTSGMVINILDYGARLNAVQIPDSRGHTHEMLLGSSQLEAYVSQPFYSGMSLIQPSDAQIILPPLHQTIWQADSTTHTDAASVQFSFTSTTDTPQAQNTPPLTIKITYTLTTANELIIRSQFEPDNAAPIHITHHPYWNLSGAGQGDVLGHVLQIWAEYYANVDEAGNPSNTFIPLKESAFDFSQPQHLGEKWMQTNPVSNYDACFLLNSDPNTTQANTTRQRAACVRAPESSRTLNVYTTQPVLRFYMNQLQGNYATTHTPLAESNMPNWFCLSTLNLSKPAQSTSPPETQVGIPCQAQETLYEFIW